jgi:hypothetical protein
VAREPPGSFHFQRRGEYAGRMLGMSPRRRQRLLKNRSRLFPMSEIPLASVPLKRAPVLLSGDSIARLERAPRPNYQRIFTCKA